MIRLTTLDVAGFKPAITGMRNPLNSWHKSDSGTRNVSGVPYTMPNYKWCIGEKDRELAMKLVKAGPEHAKFLRQIVCWVDIAAPRFWWIEFDTYRVGVEKNSCSTMHTIMKREFNLSDFGQTVLNDAEGIPPHLQVLPYLNKLREKYLASEDETEKRQLWRELIEALPQSYMQKRTVMMSYQAIRQMCQQRRGHKLYEWRDFIRWARTLPESCLIFAGEEEHET